MKLEYISSKTINFPYINGKNVVLKTEDSTDCMKALVFYSDEKIIGISMAQNPMFKKGFRCSIELLYKENLLQLDCTVKYFENGILYLNMPRNATILQQRGDLRIGCNIKSSIERFSTGKIKNISAGGAYVQLDSPINASLFNKNNFKLCFSINNIDLRLNCETIELTDKYIRVKFINLDENIKELLTLYCCSTDADNFRRAKNER